MPKRTIVDAQGRNIAYGDPGVAFELIANANKVLVLSDSTWNRGLEALMKPFFRTNRTKVAVDYSSFPSSGAQDAMWGSSSLLGGTQNYSPYISAYEVPFPASFGAISSWLSNRLATVDFSIPVLPNNGIPLSGSQNSLTYSGCILRQSQTAGARVTVEYYAGPHGDPQEILYVRVANQGNTVLGESTYFSNYAATPEIRTISVDVASWSGTGLRVAVSGKGSTTPAASKFFVLLQTRVEVLSSVATNQRWDVLSTGGETVAMYIDSNRLSNDAWARINAQNYGAVIVALGVNAFEQPDAATWRTNYRTLLDKIRGTNADLPLILTTEVRKDPPHVGFYSTLCDICDDYDDCLVLNTEDQFPDHLAMWQGFTKDWQTGSYYRMGDQVTVSNTLYQHKVLNPAAVSSTSPGSDATNWNTAAAIDGAVPTANLTKNVMSSDVTHLHDAGYRMYGSIIWSTLEAASTYYLGMSQGGMTETDALVLWHALGAPSV